MFAIGQPSTDSLGARMHEAYGSSGTNVTTVVRPEGLFGTVAARGVDLPPGSEPPGTMGTGVAVLDPQLRGQATMEQWSTPPKGEILKRTVTPPTGHV